MVTQNKKRQYKANLAGKNYTISGQATLSHFKATEKIYNQQWVQIETVAPNLSQIDQAILLTFNTISDQLYKQIEIDHLKKRVAELEEKIANQAQMAKHSIKREPKNAIGSIIDNARQDSQTHTTDKLFKQGKTL
ncbi:cell division protein ZapA [Leuconostoc palmae]|uniref:cell division protein ZapA n=1 Tax=Leuconostoc palmae TaxID=501487 RepID=UPI001C7D3EA3|nr:cell division protein ZapA [Leuconostoc palmae]